jgi:hypothetical protein
MDESLFEEASVPTVLDRLVVPPVPCNRGCDAMAIVTIIRLAIAALMQLILASVTALGPTSYTWSLRGDQHYILQRGQ